MATVTAEETRIAEVCHEAIRAYCECIGDPVQPPWGEAPRWMQQSSISGTCYHILHPGAGAEGSHEAWMRTREADGWVYGPEKDEKLKQHPCMVPFDDLPMAQKAKDYIFVAIVRSMLETRLKSSVEVPQPKEQKGTRSPSLAHALKVMTERFISTGMCPPKADATNEGGYQGECKSCVAEGRMAGTRPLCVFEWVLELLEGEE